MGKHLEDLDESQKGMLKFLGNKKEAENLEEIREYLHKEEYGSLSKKVTREKIQELIDIGYVRSRIEQVGKSREERFYLSMGVGAGKRARATLQGRNYVWGDLPKLLGRIKKVTGAILVLFSIGIFVYQTPSLSGAVVSASDVKGGDFILPFSSLILGGLLLFKSLKFKKVKKK
jgi:hypothetical protein